MDTLLLSDYNRNTHLFCYIIVVYFFKKEKKAENCSFKKAQWTKAVKKKHSGNYISMSANPSSQITDPLDHIPVTLHPKLKTNVK